MFYFVIKNGEETGISTYDGKEVKLYQNTTITVHKKTSALMADDIYRYRIFSKTGNYIRKKIIPDDSMIYYFKTEASGNTVTLVVYKASFDGYMLNYTEVFHVSAVNGINKVTENGEEDILFWHEFFATCLAMEDYDEKNVNTFSMEQNPMAAIRKAFPSYMQENPFLFFEKIKNAKKSSHKNYNPAIFRNVPRKK